MLAPLESLPQYPSTSGTVQYLHISEYAYIQDIDELKAGSFQAVSRDGNISIESTANGMNHFYEDWFRDGTLWTKSFFGLANCVHKEYTSAIIKNGKYDDYLDKYSLTQEQKNWWYEKLEELGGDFALIKQEYPVSEEDAFRQSGESIFRYLLDDLGQLDAIREEGNATIYVEPKQGHYYCLGADSSGGFKDGDSSTFYVIDNKTYELCATYESKKAPHLFGQDIERWARFYNSAFAGIEVNNHGLAVINEIKDTYPDLYQRERRDKVSDEITLEVGWYTTEKSRHELIDEIFKTFIEKIITKIPKPLYREMSTFIRDPETGKIAASPGCHDDHVLAFGITLMMVRHNPFFEYSSRRSRTFMGKPV